MIHKSRCLTQAFALFCKTGSIDCLKHTANGSCYFVKEKAPGIIEYNNESNDTAIYNPIASLVCCTDHFLSIGKVIDITFDNQHIDKISLKYLNKLSFIVTYQMLNIASDDFNEKHNWQWSYRCESL